MRSDSVKLGLERAPHRSLFKALGLTEEELNRPLIGVVNAQSQIVPGHMHLDQITAAVKTGVAMAGGTPIEFPAIGVCDGIAMGHIGMHYSLPTRELIADSIEAMALAHGFDGLVLIPNCDKIVPGMLMAAARLNIPTIVVSGGPMLKGRSGEKELSLTDMF
ncbi:MAG: dihydroxy-acid dehydratase, partial [Firmicutes bacterium]|nr:dihydroxy-acid dehydratase [Bacillota bacterium]